MNNFFTIFKSNKGFQLILLIFLLFYLNSCGFYRPVDAKKIPPRIPGRPTRKKFL